MCPPQAAAGERLRLLVMKEDRIAAERGTHSYVSRIVYADALSL